MVNLAVEIVRWNWDMAALKEAIELTTSGARFIVMPEGPHAEKGKADQKRRDRSAKWI